MFGQDSFPSHRWTLPSWLRSSISLRLILSLRRARDVLGIPTTLPVALKDMWAIKRNSNMALSSRGSESIASPTASFRSAVASTVFINGFWPGAKTMSCSNSVP